MVVAREKGCFSVFVIVADVRGGIEEAHIKKGLSEIEMAEERSRIDLYGAAITFDRFPKIGFTEYSIMEVLDA